MRKPVILLLDDERPVLEALEAQLAPAFEDLARVEVFDTPAEALAAVGRWQRERRALAVAVVDEKMPGLSGTETIARLRASEVARDLHAILLTGYGGLDSAVGAINRAGVERYLEKPWSEEELTGAVRALLLRHLESRGVERGSLLEAEVMARRSRRLRRPGAVHRARILGLGTHVPPRLLTNADLETMVDTTSEWILQRTGIRQRHVVDEGTATSDLALEAARRALERAGLEPKELDAIIVATTTPDMRFPATACLVQEALGAPHAWGFDLGAACSGFVYALATGAQLVGTGACRHVLVIGAEVMSSIIDYTDRATCVLFGDGAGAVVLGPSDDPGVGVLDHALVIDGSGRDALKMPAGGSRLPASRETVDQRLHYVHQDGRAVFKFAVRRLEEMSRLVLDRNDLDGEDLDLLVPHQANRRIILSAAERLGLDRSKVVINLDRYGNTTAASIPIALAEAEQEGRLRAGSLIMLAAVGAGFTMGSMLVRWG
jgi:3-oxoacyl-[acyl-carrier-protein] synthase-3